ncbi:hypothetical protein ACFFSY_23655 [Paenibacillus aurantiacus]|uniref:Uncharacterized protein n=1 Tax=Paenibacillus aurantiacus TaxID=1936118 RepID=A0ABV5KY00_9BACL
MNNPNYGRVVVGLVKAEGRGIVLQGIAWKCHNLWQGCILASIAHAIDTAHNPEFAHEQSWDGCNYNVQNTSGTRGTVTFQSEYMVAAFRNEHSERLRHAKDALDYLIDSPDEVKSLAEQETLQYLLDDVDGQTVPLITTAFWGDGEGIYSQDAMGDMLENGGFLLERQALDADHAINEWQAYYDMSETQTILLRSLFKRKIEAPSEVLVLTREEIQLIGSEDEAGLAESRISFEEIGMKWEGDV